MRRHIPALSLFGSLILLPACSSTAAPHPVPPSARAAGPDLGATVEVFALQHVDAAETADVVNDLIRAAGGRDTRVVADARVNALLVHGDPVQRAHIRDLLTELDRPPPR